MRSGGRATIVSPTVGEDCLQVLVVRQALDDLQGGLFEDPAPQVGDEVKEAGGDQELVQPQGQDLNEEPAGTGKHTK